MKRISEILLGLFVASALALAVEIPPLTSHVMDQASVLSIDNALNAALSDYEARTGVQLAVWTLNDLGEESIEQVSMQAAESWKLGQKGRDNGALLVVAVKNHRVRIEAGYGLESKLTDYQCGRIIRERITPYFKMNDYNGGVSEGLKAMASVIAAPVTGKGKSRANEGPRSVFAPFFSLFMIFIFLRLFRRNPMAALLLGSMMSGGRSSGGFRGGGFGGGGFGGFSGGGGSFGGGGASGSW